MTTSPTGRKFIEGLEGIKLKAYQDGGGVCTIGVGHTAGVKQGDICTWEQADQWLTGDLKTAENAVNAYVKVPLTQNQFDALVSFTFNLGAGSLEHSTLLSLLNQGAVAGAANQFLAWIKVKGVDSPGLLNRRTTERALFLTPVETPPQSEGVQTVSQRPRWTVTIRPLDPARLVLAYERNGSDGLVGEVESPGEADQEVAFHRSALRLPHR